jgi:hypothetical protein
MAIDRKATCVKNWANAELGTPDTSNKNSSSCGKTSDESTTQANQPTSTVYANLSSCVPTIVCQHLLQIIHFRFHCLYAVRPLLKHIINEGQSIPDSYLSVHGIHYPLTIHNQGANRLQLRGNATQLFSFLPKPRSVHFY